jgi:hypothetical protein
MGPEHSSKKTGRHGEDAIEPMYDFMEELLSMHNGKPQIERGARKDGIAKRETSTAECRLRLKELKESRAIGSDHLSIAAKCVNRKIGRYTRYLAKDL